MAYKIRDKVTGEVYTVDAPNVQEAQRMYKSGMLNKQETMQLQQPQSIQQQLTPDEINNLLSKTQEQKDINTGYIEGLQKLYDRAGAYNVRDIGTNMLTRGLDSFYGIDVFNKPLQNRGWTNANVNRLNILKELNDAKAANFNLDRDIIANASIAKTLNLSPEVALGNRDIFKAIAPILSSMTNAEARKYAVDKNTETRLVNNYLDNLINYYMARNKIDLALQLQNMRDANKLQTTYMNQVGWANDPTLLMNAMAQFGYPIAQPQQQQQVTQPNSYTPQTANSLFK